jgi:ATP-dependent helicase YprA (DUF1998 family)
VSENYHGYRRLIDEKTISTEPLNLEPIIFETISVWIEFTLDGMRDLAHRDLAGSLHGAEHALIAMMPYHVLCDRWDLGGLSSACSAQALGRPVIFIYDGFEGGIGLPSGHFICTRNSVSLQNEWCGNADVRLDVQHVYTHQNAEMIISHLINGGVLRFSRKWVH